jgi:hypothetical protein
VTLRRPPCATNTVPSPGAAVDAAKLSDTEPRNTLDVGLEAESSSLTTSLSGTHSPSGSDGLWTLARRSVAWYRSTRSCVKSMARLLPWSTAVARTMSPEDGVKSARSVPTPLTFAVTGKTRGVSAGDVRS